MTGICSKIDVVQTQIFCWEQHGIVILLLSKLRFFLCLSGDLFSAGTRSLRWGCEPEWAVPHQPRQTTLEENGAAGKTLANSRGWRVWKDALNSKNVEKEKYSLHNVSNHVTKNTENQDYVHILMRQNIMTTMGHYDHLRLCRPYKSYNVWCVMTHFSHNHCLLKAGQDSLCCPCASLMCWFVSLNQCPSSNHCQ